MDGNSLKNIETGMRVAIIPQDPACTNISHHVSSRYLLLSCIPESPYHYKGSSIWSLSIWSLRLERGKGIPKVRSEVFNS